jgi:hypothetical protein
MPPFTPEVQTKLDALRDLFAAARTNSGPNPRAGEVVEITFGEPDGVKYFCWTPYDAMHPAHGFGSPVLPELTLKILPTKGAPFVELPLSTAVSDDKATITFGDFNYETTALFAKHGEGLRVRVFSYFPQVDLLLEEFIGSSKAPKPEGRGTMKLEVVAGFRSPDLLLPNRRAFASCPFIYGGHLKSQAEIDEHDGCPSNLHLVGIDPAVGTLVPIVGLNDPSTGQPWADCARDRAATCAAHLGTTRFFPGFLTVIESVPNGRSGGRNVYATAIGNEGALTDPIRMIYGYRLVKGLRLISLRPENDSRHPDKGWIAFLFEVSEGPLHLMKQPFVNGVYVGFEHLQSRNGRIGQPPTGFSLNTPSFSGTAHFYGRIQGDYHNATAGSLEGAIWVEGYEDIRVYSDAETYVEQYSTVPAWCVLDALTRKRGGYGEDHARYDIQSAIDVAAWQAEQVAMHDPNGNLFAGTRHTFNAELNARTVQQQMADACAAARMAVPFEWQGKKTFRALKKETIDDTIPVFTEDGPDRNICYDGAAPLVTPSWVSDDELTNQVIVKFDDESNTWIETQLTFSDQLQQLKAGAAQTDSSVRVISKTYPAFGVTNMSEAARFGILTLYLGLFDNGGIKNNLRFVITTWFTYALGIQPYSLVRLKLRALDALKAADPARFNFDYFRVIKKVRKGDLKVELTCQAYPVDFYESIEDVTQPPPLIATGYQPNIGGTRFDLPYPVRILDMGHTNDRIFFRLGRGDGLPDEE